MKTLLSFLICIFVMTSSVSCSHNSDWDELPSPIAEFISRYFPGQGVEDYGETNDVYHVRLRNSVALSFNRIYSWITVNGYGETLPEMFLFDQLPPALYEYIQEISRLNSVYSVHRDKTSYSVNMLDNAVVYNIKTGLISEVTTNS